MKVPKEIINAFIIFAGIAVYFVVIDLLGFSNVLWLRMFNVLFVWYGVTRTLSDNVEHGRRDYGYNLVSSGATALLGVVFSTIGLLTYIHLRGGDTYIEEHLSSQYLFGGEPTANQYCIGIFIEGIASAVMVVFVSVQYWRKKMQAQG
jgi:hypothetical protein